MKFWKVLLIGALAGQAMFWMGKIVRSEVPQQHQYQHDYQNKP